MKNTYIFLITAILLWPSAAVAQPADIDARTREVSNQVILNIFSDILEEKESYPDLQLFTKFALSKNDHGIYEIKYSHLDPQSRIKKYPLEFWLTVQRIDEENPYSGEHGAFDYTFPLLDLKISGYQARTPKQKQFRLDPLVKRHGGLLLEHQNTQMPLRLTLEPTKDQFYVNEDVEITATLTNVSNKNILVKELSSQTVYFLYGNSSWGSAQYDPDEYVPSVVLKPGESISRNFIGEGLPRPKTIDIYGSYIMTFKGVKPTAQISIPVEKY